MRVIKSLGSCFSSRKLPQYAAAIIANLIVISYGIVQSWTSPSLPILRSNSTTLQEPITDDQETWLGSITSLSALFFCPIYSYINQNFGRKIAGYLTAAPLFVAWLIIIFAKTITLFYVARILMGMTSGGVNVFVVMYVGEISDDTSRGALGSIRGVAADIGILLAYCIGPYLSIPMMATLCVILPIFFFISFFWLPESPMFLMTKGKKQEALAAYMWLRGGDTEAADEEFQKLDELVQKDSEKVTFVEILKNRGTRKALVIAIVFAIVTQWSGISVVFSYTNRLFQMSGSTLSPDIATIVVGIVNLTGSIAALFGADLAGRRFCLISTQIVQTISLGCLGVYLYLGELGFDVQGAGVLPVICLSVFCFCIVAGMATLGYVVLSEIFRPEARGVAAGVMNVLTWSLAFLVTKFHYSLEAVMGLYGCFWLYASVALVGALFTFFQLPETKNRSLDSILKELNGD